MTTTLPTSERRNKKAYAVIECFQEIPCNPCVDSCPIGAIEMADGLNALAVINYDKCTGCGICVGICPGLAIFLIDETKEEGRVHITLPYEYSVLPELQSTVLATDREGSVLGEGRVVALKVVHGTQLVTISVAAALIDQARGIQLSASDDETIICRCEGITLAEVRRLIEQGYHTLDEIKRISRTGMGPCTGRICRQLIAREIAKATGQPIESIDFSSFRPPTKPISIGKIVRGIDEA